MGGRRGGKNDGRGDLHVEPPDHGQETSIITAGWRDKILARWCTASRTPTWGVEDHLCLAKNPVGLWAMSEVSYRKLSGWPPVGLPCGPTLRALVEGRQPHSLLPFQISIYGPGACFPVSDPHNARETCLLH